MSDRLSRIEAQLQQMGAALDDVVRRLDAVEGTRHPESPVAADAPAIHVAPSRVDPSVAFTLIGRTCLVLGGAFLLRAVTQGGHVAPTPGVLLGLLYALVWILAAERASPLSAVFHGATAQMIGLPIIWEAATRFHVLSPAMGALAVFLLAGPALAVAWHRRLRFLAAAVVLGGLAVTLVLTIALGELGALAAVPLAAALATVWLGYERGCRGLAIVAAIIVDVMLMAITLWTVLPGRVASGTFLVTLVVFATIYLGSFAVRAWVQRQPLRGFEFVQGVVALALGLTGVFLAAAGDDSVRIGAGVAAALTAALAYGAGVASRRRQAPASAFLFFTSVGLALAVTAAVLLLPDAALQMSLAIAGVAGMAAASRIGAPGLAVHAAAALAAAIALSALPAIAAAAWRGFGSGPWPVMPRSVWIVMAAPVAAFALSGWLRSPARPFTAAAVRVAAASMVAFVLVTFVFLILEILVAPGVGRELVVAVKTATLAGIAVVVAWAARVPALADLSVLTYPVLMAIGVKILAADVRTSPPAMIFVALAIFGAALIVAPRALGRRRAVESGSVQR